MRNFNSKINNLHNEVKFAYAKNLDCFVRTIESEVKIMKKYDELQKERLCALLKAKRIECAMSESKQTLVNKCIANNKSLSMGNRNMSCKASERSYFFTKRNTYAASVCKAIALEHVKSKLDIRRLVCNKYSFKQTLERLAYEDIIAFTDDKRSEFHLTAMGKQLSELHKVEFDFYTKKIA